jgi:hypothetical protein
LCRGASFNVIRLVAEAVTAEHAGDMDGLMAIYASEADRGRNWRLSCLAASDRVLTQIDLFFNQLVR